MTFAYLDRDYPLAIAHRGGAGEAPENSWQAFEHAHQLGFRYMETDARLTADGQVIAFHDAGLKRVAGLEQRVKKSSWQELQRVRVQQYGRIPKISDLLDAFPDTCFNIDMKCDEVMAPLFSMIRRKNALPRICLASFYDHRITTARQEFNNRVCTSAGRQGVIRQMLRSRGLPLRPPESTVLQVPLIKFGVSVANDGFIHQTLTEGSHIHIWTVDQASEMHRLLNLGVQGIVTDRPSRLKSVLVERGEWR